MTKQLVTALSIPLCLLAIAASAFYEQQFVWSFVLSAGIIVMFFAIQKPDGIPYFAAAITATMLCSTAVWVMTTAGHHVSPEGFDAMRYDWAARNYSPDSIIEGPRNAWVSYPAAILYQLFEANIATVAVFNFSLIASAALLFAHRFRTAYALSAKPLFIAFLLSPELIFHSGILAKEPLNFAAALFFATPLLELYERRYSLTGLASLVLSLVLASLVRIEVMLIFLACAAVVFVLRSSHKALSGILMAGVAALTAMLLRDFFMDWLATSAMVAEAVIEEQGSIDPLKQLIRDSTVTTSITDKVLLTPVKLVALSFGPLPKASLIDLIGYAQSGVDKYVIVINLFNKITACILLALAVILIRRRLWRTFDRADISLLIIGAVGLVVAAAVPPFLHLRYRIPYAPFLLMPIIRAGATVELLKVVALIYGITEMISIVFYLLPVVT